MATSKYEEFESYIIALNRILKKVERIFNVSNYKKEIEKIKNEIDETQDVKKSNIPEIDYSKYVNQLCRIEKEMNEEYLPYYEIYLLSRRIECLLNDISENNYRSLKDAAIELINCLSKLKYSDKDKQQNILKEAYKAIYHAICNEFAIEKHEILECVKKTNKLSLNENLATLIEEDINNLPELERVNIELNHRNEGLGNNYLNDDAINKVSLVELQDKNDKYQARKKTAAMEFLDKAKNINEEVIGIKSIKEERQRILRRLSLKRFGIHMRKLLCYVLIPSVVACIISYFGSKDETYSKITSRTYNKDTKEQVGEETSEYGIEHYSYKISIKRYSPWKKNKDKNGYNREVTEFVYSTNDDVGEGLNPDDVIKSLRDDIKVNVEEKEVVSEEELTNEPLYLVTEYFNDKTDTRSDRALIVFLTLFGTAFLGGPSIFGYLISDLRQSDNKKLGNIKKELSCLIKRKVIKEKRVLVGDKIVTLQEEVKNYKNKYGDITEMITPEEIESVKKYIYAK